MRTIRVSHEISMGHRLMSYKGICSSPHGHNAKFTIQMYVPPKVFLDFKFLSEMMKLVLEPLDHAMVLEKGDPLLEVCATHRWRYVQLEKEPTTEYIAQFVYEQLTERLKENCVEGKIVWVKMDETSKYSSTYYP